MTTLEQQYAADFARERLNDIQRDTVEKYLEKHGGDKPRLRLRYRPAGVRADQEFRRKDTRDAKGRLEHQDRNAEQRLLVRAGREAEQSIPIF